MKASGYVRQIDELGRVAIPKELRDEHEFEENAPVEIWVSDKGDIVVEKYKELCYICRNPGELVDFCNRRICKECIELAKQIS